MMRNIPPLAAVAAAALLGSVGAAAAPPQRAAPVAEADIGPRAGDGWWLAFGDPVLTAVIERALSDSPAMEQAAAHLDRARAGARATRAALLPQIGAGAGARAFRQSLQDPMIRPFASFPGFQREIERYHTSLSASWEIDFFGAAPRLRATRATAAAAAAVADVAAARITVAAETATAYFNVRELQTRREIARLRVDTLERQRAALRLRLAAGTLAPIDFDRIEGEAEATATAVPVLEVLLASEVARLGVLVGDADAAKAAADTPVPNSAGPSDAAGQLKVGRGQRPDIIAARARLVAADAGIETARALRWPKLSIETLVATVASRPVAMFLPSATAAQGGASLMMPLLDFGRIGAAIADARGARRAALADYRQTLLQAAADIEVTTVTLARRRSEAERQTAAAVALRRAEAAATATYRAGAIDLTTLLDTQRGSLAAQENAAVAQTASSKALVALFRASAGEDGAGEVRSAGGEAP